MNKDNKEMFEMKSVLLNIFKIFFEIESIYILVPINKEKA